MTHYRQKELDARPLEISRELPSERTQHVKPHHHILFGCFLSFVIGMILGVVLSGNVLLWISIIVLVALALGFLGKSTMKKPHKRRLARQQEQ